MSDNYIAKCCGHAAERHLDMPASDMHGECCEMPCECKTLSEEAMTVLEALNAHYGTSKTVQDFEHHDGNMPKEWSHNLSTGPYGKVLAINLTRSNDVHGYNCPVETANYQVLQENWKECEALCDAGFSNCYSIGLEWEKPAPADLIETLAALDNYPLLDDELHSQLENDWIDEAWKDYGFRDAVKELIGVLAKEGIATDEIDLLEIKAVKEELYQDIRWSETSNAYWETGGGAVFTDKFSPEMVAKYKFGLKIVRQFVPIEI